ncbi:MAG: flagellar biosynthesis protein FlhB [Romboutsia sp.]|nr:flagellar biosynthesis protein FlhB [Romboutsia sp.]
MYEYKENKSNSTDNINYEFNINLQLFNEDSSQEKTELPTQRKLKKAREKGQIFKSKDIIDNVSILTSLVLIKIFTPYFSNQFTNYFNQIFNSFDLNTIESKNIKLIFELTLLTFLKIIIPFLFILLITGIIANIAQVGFLYSTEVLKFDLKKLNPISGLKRMFSKRSLLETIKMLAKFLVIVLFILFDFSDKLFSVHNLIFLDINTSSSLMLSEIFSYLLKVCIILFIFSFVDYYFQKKFYIKDMKMTKQEIKQEYKEMEGDPFIKGKIKEKQRQLTLNTLMTNTKDSTVIVTNPTHLSVGIRWEMGMPAPLITIMGSDSTAMKIRSIARDNDIPIIENKPLARALYNECEMGQYIPNEYWALVAQVLNYVLSLKS